MFSWFIESASWVILESFSAFFSAIITMVAESGIEKFAETFPVIEDFQKSFQVLGGSLAVVFAVWQLFKNVAAPMVDNAEHPLKVVGRLIVALTLIVFAVPISKQLFDITATILVDFNGVDTSISLTDFLGNLVSSTKEVVSVQEEGFLNQIGELFSEGVNAFVSYKMAPISAIVTLVFAIVLMINMIRLVLAMIQRYIIVAVLLYTSPLAFSTLSTATTGQMFSSWLRMYCGHLFVLVLDTIGVKAILSSMAQTGKLMNFSEIAIWIFMVIGFIRVILNFEEILRSVGINVVPHRSDMMAEMMAVSRIMGMAGKPASIGADGAISKGSGILGMATGTVLGGAAAVGAASAVAKAGGSVGQIVKTAAGGIPVVSAVRSASGAVAGAARSGAASVVANRAMGKSGTVSSSEFSSMVGANAVSGKTINTVGSSPTASGEKINSFSNPSNVSFDKNSNTFSGFADINGSQQAFTMSSAPPPGMSQQVNVAGSDKPWYITATPSQHSAVNQAMAATGGFGSSDAGFGAGSALPADYATGSSFASSMPDSVGASAGEYSNFSNVAYNPDTNSYSGFCASTDSYGNTQDAYFTASAEPISANSTSFTTSSGQEMYLTAQPTSQAFSDYVSSDKGGAPARYSDFSEVAFNGNNNTMSASCYYRNNAGEAIGQGSYTMYNTSAYDKPIGAHDVVKTTDGQTWFAQYNGTVNTTDKKGATFQSNYSPTPPAPKTASPAPPPPKP